jgi:CRISPR/Cas system-associated exonuclease Cas4 (RecB family)
MYFLDRIAKELVDKYGQDMGQLQLVFPSRRTAQYLLKAIAEHQSTVTWSPRFYSIEELFRLWVSTPQPDRMILISFLHKAYQEVSGQPESLDSFWFWGDMLLKDFDAVDRGMINPEQIFKAIKDQQELDAFFEGLGETELEALRLFWKSLETQNTSTEKEAFLTLWELLLPLYHTFHKVLQEQGWIYSGQRYRQAVEGLLQGQWGFPEGTWIFIGFNQLTEAEKIVLQQGIQHKQAQVYWDIDAWYVNDPEQEAGTFIRRYSADPVLKPTLPEEPPRYIEQGTGIWEIREVPVKSAQPRAAGALLHSLLTQQGYQPKDIGIILPGEELLYPLLNSLPLDIPELKVNLTMGFPLKNTPWYSLISYWLRLQQESQGEQDKTWVGHAPIQGLLQHPFLNDSIASSVLHQLLKYNRIRVSFASLKNQLKESTHYPLWELLLEKIKPAAAAERLLNLLSLLEPEPEDKGFLAQFFYQLYAQVNIFQELLNTHLSEEEIIQWPSFFRQYLFQLRIPFEGTGIDALQIMGPLESRNLDFKVVIILSMEEGSFPPQPDAGSFIPYNIRRAFHLPVTRDQDAAFAYYLYRLLQHTEKGYLFYTPLSEGVGGREPSRFLLQLLAEFPKHRIFSAPEKLSALTLKLQPPTLHLSVTERGKLLALLQQEKGLSPSAINTFLDCRLKFYYQYIARIQEPSAFSEELDARTLGNILHKLMEILYEPFCDTGIVTPEQLIKQKEKIPEALNLSFEQVLREKDLSQTLQGRNLLIRSVLQQYATQIIDTDAKLKDLRLTSQEKSLVHSLEVSAFGEKISINIGGKVDRIDQVNGINRIIDYKTGKDDTEIKSLSFLIEGENEKRNKAAFQLWVYAWVWEKLNPGEKLTLGLYTVKDLFQTTFDPRLKIEKQPVEIVNPFLADFENLLQNILTSLLDPDLEISATEILTRCSYCPYAGICHRD